MVRRIETWEQLIRDLADKGANGLVQLVQIGRRESPHLGFACNGTECTNVGEHVFDGGTIALVLREVLLDYREQRLAVIGLCQLIANDLADSSDVRDQWRLAVAGHPDRHGTARAQEQTKWFLIAR